MSMPMLAGVGLLVICCSSSSAMMMRGGSEETPATGAGADADAGAGADADTTTPTTTTFHDSILPGAADATIVETGFEWSHGTVIEPPNKSYNMVLQGDNNMCINGPKGGIACLMSHQVGGTAKAFFQTDGNICIQGTERKCYMSHDSNVPSKQHRLVLHNNGKVYIDHGTGVAGRYNIYTPPATETYVLPY